MSDSRDDGRRPDVRDATNADVPAVPGQTRHPDVRQHGNAGCLWVHVFAQGLHDSDPRGQDMDHIGGDQVRFHQLWWPRPVPDAPVSGQAIPHTPNVRRAQLRHAGRVVGHAVVLDI